ncbi:hypothetical protein [Sediminicoccus rosea]|uniref:Uncharacterized protein n=1 Tax=Sediminicoccus rosea TaxID=1225128 RepID=A0ABZ0PE91_9PROT|nr:hypothetical protein [Sediminicoccus rosea]WPB83945.1 hypothetical protein R9Z33_17760 [Sediminicoccus rosea]
MTRCHHLALLLTLGTALPALAQQALPLPRVEFELEARVPEMDGAVTLRHRGGVLRFEGAADGGRMLLLQNLASGEVRGVLEEGGQRMALPSAEAMLPWAGLRARREGEARIAGESCTLWRVEETSPGVLCLTADGVPLRYQQPATPGMGGDAQHFDRRPPGPRPMETMFEAVRVMRRPQAPALFDMASLPQGPAMPAAPAGAAMPGMPPGMTIPGMPPGMTIPGMPSGMTIPGMPPGMSIPGMASPAPAAPPAAPPAASVARAASNPADFARYPRPARSRGSLPPNVTAAEAGEAISAQIGQMVMMLRLCGWAEQEAGFKAAFGLQTHERLGFTPQDAARAYDQAAAAAAEMTQAFGADPQALTLIRVQMCQPALRDNLSQSIANGTVF